jgi:hypothetical protein
MLTAEANSGTPDVAEKIWFFRLATAGPMGKNRFLKARSDAVPPPKPHE